MQSVTLKQNVRIEDVILGVVTTEKSLRLTAEGQDSARNNRKYLKQKAQEEALARGEKVVQRKEKNEQTTRKVCERLIYASYVLNVHADATKTDIRKALTRFFGVEVERINTCITRGEEVRRAVKRGSRASVLVKQANVKKAYVRLKSGFTLPEMESV